MMFSTQQVNKIVEDVLKYREAHGKPLFNLKVADDGSWKFDACLPNRHILTHKLTKESMLVRASEQFMVICEKQNRDIVVVHLHELQDYSISEVNSAPVPANPVYADVLPGIGSVHTHKNGNAYLVYGYTNLKANEKNRDRYPVMICYIGENGLTWSKTAEAFAEMTPGGNFRFKEGVSAVYYGIVENGSLENGYLTSEIQALMEAGENQ